MKIGILDLSVLALSSRFDGPSPLVAVEWPS